jgi:hypothetical protein
VRRVSVWERTTSSIGAEGSPAPGRATPRHADTPCARPGSLPWGNAPFPRHDRHASASGRPSAHPPAGCPVRAAAVRFLRPVVPTRAPPTVGRDATGEIPRFRGTGSLSRIDHDDPFEGFDHPGIDGQGFGPIVIEHGVETAPKSLSSVAILPPFDRHGSRLDGMNTRRFTPLSFPLIRRLAFRCARPPRTGA